MQILFWHRHFGSNCIVLADRAWQTT